MIPYHELVKVICGLLRHPYPHVCVDFVASELLSLLEQYGYPVTDELAGAVVRSESDIALGLLEKR